LGGCSRGIRRTGKTSFNGKEIRSREKGGRVTEDTVIPLMNPKNWLRVRIPTKEITCSDPMSIRIRAQRSWQFYVDGLIDIRQ
jgi:hypothetical protein